jgi:hypothetical protein
MQKENISLLSKEEAGDVSVTQEQSRQVRSESESEWIQLCIFQCLTRCVTSQFLTDVRTQASQNGAHEDTTMAERDDDLSADNLVCIQAVSSNTHISIHRQLTFLYFPVGYARVK